MTPKEINFIVLKDLNINGPSTLDAVAARTSLERTVVVKRILGSGPGNLEPKFRYFSIDDSFYPGNHRLWRISDNGRKCLELLEKEKNEKEI